MFCYVCIYPKGYQLREGYARTMSDSIWGVAHTNQK